MPRYLSCALPIMPLKASFLFEEFAGRMLFCCCALAVRLVELTTDNVPVFEAVYEFDGHSGRCNP